MNNKKNETLKGLNHKKALEIKYASNNRLREAKKMYTELMDDFLDTYDFSKFASSLIENVDTTEQSHFTIITDNYNKDIDSHAVNKVKYGDVILSKGDRVYLILELLTSKFSNITFTSQKQDNAYIVINGKLKR